MSSLPPQTEDELEASVEANTEFVSCPQAHVGPLNDYHKEPYVAASPGDVADAGVTRSVIHAKDPGGIYYTTVEGVYPPRHATPVSAPGCVIPDPPPGPCDDFLTVNHQSSGMVAAVTQVYADRNTHEGVYTKIDPGCGDSDAGNPHPNPRWTGICDDKWNFVTTDPTFRVGSMWHKGYYPGAAVAGDYIEARLATYYTVERGILRFATSGVGIPGKELCSCTLTIRGVAFASSTDRNSPNDIAIHVVPCATSTFPVTTPAIAQFNMGTTYASFDILDPAITDGIPFNLTLPIGAVNLSGDTVLGFVTTHDRDNVTPPIQPADEPPAIPFHQEAPSPNIQDIFRVDVFLASYAALQLGFRTP